MKGKIIHSRKYTEDKLNLNKSPEQQGKTVEEVINKLFPNREIKKQ